MPDAVKCKAEVWNGWRFHKCARNAKRDGYCTQHHPDTKKAKKDKRQAEADARSREWQLADRRKEATANLIAAVALCVKSGNEVPLLIADAHKRLAEIPDA